MNASSASSIGFREQAGARTSLLLLVVLIIGFAAGALVAYRSTKATSQTPFAENNRGLSESTKAALGQLRSPVEVRFYALFGGDNSPASLREFAGHVSELLSALETEAQGKLILVRYDTWTPANTMSAASDGLVPFDVGKGDPSYVGVAVAQGARRETLAQLAPEWASALEFDLARAISRVSSLPPMLRTAEDVAQTARAEEAVKGAIRNPAATSLDAGKQVLRDASLKEFGDTVSQMNREVAKAEQQAGAANSEADRQAALQQLQQVRAKYAEKLREVALRSQAEIEAWTKLKRQ